jgi:hypothetical protein
MTIEELQQQALAVAGAMKALPTSEAVANVGGSRHRELPEDIRRQFIQVRGALFDRGIYDPVLVRFDTATVTQAPTSEIAEALETLATSLTPAGQ